MTEQESRRGKSRRERVEFARSRDILDVANELQMELVRSGRDYRWKEHDSLVISPDKNLWKWFSRNTGGDAISLVETIKELSFNQSVDFLNDGNFKEFQMVERPQEDFKYYLEKYEQPFSAGRDYLRNQRGLSDETIDYFLEQGVLAQANAKLDYFAEGNSGSSTNAIEPVIVFKSLSSSGEVVGASLQGIQENWEKWPKHGYAKVIMKNSDPMTGIHVDIGSPKRLIFTESPIDLMSYYELHKDSLQDVRLVSMDGLKESTIGRHLSQIQAEISGKPLRWTPEQMADGLKLAINHHFFEDGKNADLITLALDNDKAGRAFIQELEAKGAVINSDLPELRPGQDKTDWNDALRTQNQQSSVDLSAVSVENEKSFNNPLDLVRELHRKWEDELAEKIREDLGINHELQAWQFEKEMSRFITTDLDKLFAKRTRLERDAYFADSTTSIRKEIDRLDAQILEYIEKAPEQSQEKTDWNDALRTQNQQSSVDLSAVSVENEKSFNNPLELVWELHGKWEDELAEKIREDLGINHELQAWQFEKEMSRFITTDLDKLFAKRTRLERDAYFADSTTSIRKEIDRLDAQILEYIEKAPEQSQEKTDWNDALRTQNQQSSVDLSAVSVENEKSFNNPLELVWELHGKWEDELAEKIREDLGINHELQAWQFEKEMSRFITTDLDKLFAKRTRLERDAYFADSTTSIRKEIDRLDAQILEYIEKAPEQSQEKTDWNDALRTQNQQSSVDLSAVSVENEKSFNNPLELVWELHGKWEDELAEKIREDLGINHELQAWQFEKEMSRFITTDLDKLFAKRTRLERDAYFADSTTSIRKEIDRLDAQILEYIEKAPEQSQEKTDWNDVLKNQQEEKSDNSRLAQARRKLERLKGEQDEAISRAYSHQALTNGQPMNDKRGGASFMRKQEQIEGQVFSKMDEIRKQEERVERLEHQQHLKEMGLNRQGSGLEMSVQNIPRIREELEKAKRGESFFTKATLKRYQEELTRLEAISEQMDKTSIQPATQALIDEGLVNQWQKQPNTYFVKGLRRVALELTEEGEFQLSSQTKYHPKTDEERLKVDELLAKQAQGSIGVKPMIQEERSSVPPELFVAFDFTENPNLSQKFSSGDVIPYKDFIAQLYEENNLRMLSLGYDKTYFALQDEKGSRLTDDFRYDIGSEDSDLSTQLGETLPSPYFEQAQKADHDYRSQIPVEENTQLRSVESEEKEKSLEDGQETTDNSEQNKKVETKLGDFPEETQGAAPLPEANVSQPLNDLSPSQTRSQPLLHFSINEERKSIHKDNYHPISDKDLLKLNRYASHLQNAAQWYLENVADSQVIYFYQDGADTNSVAISYNKESFMHLTGIYPYREGQTAEQTLLDFAAGNGQFDNILIANRGAAFDKLKVLPELPTMVDAESFYFGDLSDVEKFHTLNLDKAIRSNDQDVLLAFRTVDGTVLPASLMRLRQSLNLLLDQTNQEKIILGVFRERDGHIDQLSINEEYVKDKGAEMLSVLKNKQYEEVSKEIEQTTPDNTLNKPLLDSATFTQVLDTVYNLGVPGDISKTPEEFHQAWSQYLDYAKQHNDKFDQIVAAAGKDHLLDTNSDFYKEWQQDHIYKENYHVRLQWSEERPDGPRLPFKETELISYQDFARELYKANQDFYPIHQEGMKQVTAGNTEGYIPPTKIKFDVYAPGGEVIKEGIRYDIGDETTPISQMLGLGYRRLNGQSELASMDEEILSQLENREVNKEISQEANESARLTEEVAGQTLDTRETVAFQSSKQETKNNFLQRVEEILKEEPISDLETPEVNSSSIDYATLTPHELSEVAFQKVREYTETPERLEEYLNFMSKFPELSPRNVALIQEQWPGANAVATYNQWQSMGEVLGITSDQVFETRNTYTNKKTGRTREVVHNNLSVKTGEKSHITLFRPMMVEMIPVLDENGNQVKNEKGNPKYKRLSEATPEEKALKKEGKLKSRLFQERDSKTGLSKFATYKVFELSQTTLKPEFYPKAMPNRHYDFNMDHIRTKEVLEGLSDYAKNIGITIYQDDAKELKSAKGAFYPDEQKILLNPDNTPGEVVATTIHELAHASLHNPKFANSYKGDVSKDRRELEAEMTSYLVSKHFGLDTSEKAIRYMALWTDNLTSLDDQQLAQSMKRIHGTVSKIVKSVEQHTKPYQLNRQVVQNQDFIQSPKKGLKV